MSLLVPNPLRFPSPFSTSQITTTTHSAPSSSSSSSTMSRRVLLLLPPPPSASAATATATDTDTAVTDHRYSHLDRGLAVSFSALLAVTLAYLLIFSLRHCLRRRQHGVSDRIPDKTDAAQLRSIPITTVRKNAAAAAATTTAMDCSIQEEESTCAVCLGEYNEGEEIRTMPRCGHVFHRECIDRWLIRRSSFCPVCRGRVIQRAAEPAITSCWVVIERADPLRFPGVTTVSNRIGLIL